MTDQSPADPSATRATKLCVYCSQPIPAGGLVCTECKNNQAPRWVARLQSHWLKQSLSAAALGALAIWAYQTWSASDTDRRQRMQRLAQSAEVLQAMTEQLRQPCVAAQEECQKRFIDESTSFSVNQYNFAQEARYFTAKSDPVRAAIDFIDDFYNPGKQDPGRLTDFKYAPLQIAITRARGVLTTPYEDAGWCTAERRASMRELTNSLDIYRYCELVVRTYAWEEATGGLFHGRHNASSAAYKLCTASPDPDNKTSTTAWRSNRIGALLSNVDDFDHTAPWLFDSYCAASGLAIGGGMIPARTRQIVAVKTASWAASSGELVRYARENADSPWRSVGSPMRVVLGRGGLGWGRGLMPIPAREDSKDPFKAEGDGRSPAGLFPLGSIFAERPIADAHVSVRATTDQMYCDDRVESPTYNQVILQTQAERLSCADDGDGCPTERLKRSDGLYKQFIWVNYNSSPPVKGAGSCIFLHINHPDLSGTAGCTTASPQELHDLAVWLEPEKYPLLLQLPAAEFRASAQALRLPN